MKDCSVVFDFDDNNEWGPRLRELLRPHLPADIDQIVKAVRPEFIEDAADIVLSHTNQQVVAAAITEWLCTQQVRGYHGTRINASELNSICSDGLQPLRAQQRAERLERALSKHPRWPEVAHELPAALKLYGAGMRSGRREGQVHLTVSRAGLVDGFNHYLREGSEFDWHVSHYLLGLEGQALIAADGDAYLITMRVPGDAALAACNRFGMPTDSFPNLVSDIVRVWSYWLGDERYRASRLKLDCGMVFSDAVPASWLDQVEKVETL